MVKKKAKKVTKRGVKPGTKRGKYHKGIGKPKSPEFIITHTAGNIFKVGDKVTFNIPAYTPAQPLTLCGQLEDAILLLENRLSNAIAKINSLM